MNFWEFLDRNAFGLWILALLIMATAVGSGLGPAKVGHVPTE